MLSLANLGSNGSTSVLYIADLQPDRTTFNVAAEIFTQTNRIHASHTNMPCEWAVACVWAAGELMNKAAAQNVERKKYTVNTLARAMHEGVPKFISILDKLIPPIADLVPEVRILPHSFQRTAEYHRRLQKGYAQLTQAWQILTEYNKAQLADETTTSKDRMTLLAFRWMWLKYAAYCCTEAGPPDIHPSLALACIVHYMWSQQNVRSVSIPEAAERLHQCPKRQKIALSEPPPAISSSIQYIAALLGSPAELLQDESIQQHYHKLNLNPLDCNVNIEHGLRTIQMQYAQYMNICAGVIDATEYLDSEDQPITATYNIQKTPRRQLKTPSQGSNRLYSRNLREELMRAAQSGSSIKGTPMTMRLSSVSATPRGDRVTVARLKFATWLEEQADIGGSGMFNDPNFVRLVQRHFQPERILSVWNELHPYFPMIQNEAFLVWQAILVQVHESEIDLGRSSSSISEKILNKNWQKGVAIYCCEVVRFGLQREDIPSFESLCVEMELESFYIPIVFEDCRRFEVMIGSGLGIKMRNLVEHVAEYDAWKPGSGYAATCEYLRHRQEDTKPELTAYADISIKFLYDKLIKIMRQRIDTICPRLAMGTLLSEKVSQLIEYTISHEYELEIAQDAHIDRILVCSLLAIGLFAELGEITAKSILRQYSLLPRFSAKLFGDYESITDIGQLLAMEGFYNKVFMAQTKSQIYALMTREDGQKYVASRRIPSIELAPSSQVQIIPVTHMTPITSRLYCNDGGATLRRNKRKLEVTTAHVKKRNFGGKRDDYDDDDDYEPGMSSQPCADALISGGDQVDVCMGDS